MVYLIIQHGGHSCADIGQEVNLDLGEEKIKWVKLTVFYVFHHML